jgi:hypothetical protein
MNPEDMDPVHKHFTHLEKTSGSDGHSPTLPVLKELRRAHKSLEKDEVFKQGKRAAVVINTVSKGEAEPDYGKFYLMTNEKLWSVRAARSAKENRVLFSNSCFDGVNQVETIALSPANLQEAIKAYSNPANSHSKNEDAARVFVAVLQDLINRITEQTTLVQKDKSLSTERLTELRVIFTHLSKSVGQDLIIQALRVVDDKSPNKLESLLNTITEIDADQKKRNEKIPQGRVKRLTSLYEAKIKNEQKESKVKSNPVTSFKKREEVKNSIKKNKHKK